MQLTHKTILITGASEGIGKATALCLAAKGARVICLARNMQKLSVVVKEISQNGGLAEAVGCDLTDTAAIHRVVDEIASKYQIDGLINNAGVWHKTGQLDEITDEVALTVMQTNLTGMILLTKAVLPHLRRAQEAIIINVSSRSGHSAQAGQSVYSASKYGVRGFTEVLRADLLDTPIRVAGVYQGGTNTHMFHTAGETWPVEKLQTFIPAEGLAEVIAFMAACPAQVWLPEVRVESK
jgi:NADP-dependent 3-hydroxy acid dehydrogenase YdfG